MDGILPSVAFCVWLLALSLLWIDPAFFKSMYQLMDTWVVSDFWLVVDSVGMNVYVQGFVGGMFSGLTVLIHVVDHQDFSPFRG